MSLSMREFLENYVNLDNLLSEEIINKLENNRATHIDLTDIGLPYFQRIPYEMVNYEDLLTGRVLLVNDFKGSLRHPRIAPYIRPQLIKDKEIMKEKRLERGKYY